MANQDVKVFFKVEGLDGYISDLGDLKNALGQADAATEELSNAQSKLDDDFENLDAKLETLEGGVKVLAGSVEIAAGALGVLGLENEFFQQVEENVINIIALAEGAINISEGFKLLAQNQKIATIAQKAFNIAANANPYVLLASALTAAAGALLVWKLNSEDAVPPTEELADELDRIRDPKIQTDIDGIIGRIEALRIAAFGEEENEVTRAIDAVAELTQQIETSKEREIELFQEAAKIEDEIFQERFRNSASLTDKQIADKVAYYEKEIELAEENEEDTTQLQTFYDAYRLRESIRAEGDRQFQLTQLLEAGIAARDKLIDDARKREEREGEEREREEKKLRDRQIETLEQQGIDLVNTAANTQELITNTTVNVADGIVEQTVGLTGDQVDRITNFTDVAEGKLEGLQGFTSSTFSVLSDLNTIFTKDDEKRNKRAFEIAKRAQLAQAIIAGSLAINKAFASQLIPGDPTSLPRAIGAAALAALQTGAQIATIARQQFESPSAGGGGGGGSSAGASINYSFGQQAGEDIQPGQRSAQPQPVQAYVVATDVSNAQEANQQIENLSRL